MDLNMILSILETTELLIQVPTTISDPRQKGAMF